MAWSRRANRGSGYISGVKLITWNVNSIRSRLDRLLALLDRESPDIVCLQELKVEEKNFPFEVLDSVGYSCAVAGQKTYNGVAILTRGELTEPFTGMGRFFEDDQARVIGGDIDRVRIVCAYVPNGAQVASDKWRYKLEWLDAFGRFVEDRLTEEFVVCGDFNIAPELRDVAIPEQWEGSVLCHAVVRKWFGRFLNLGLTDVVRKRAGDGQGPYTWWDYRMLGFPKGNGLRIDHVLATEAVAARVSSARVDREERKGKKPSDHAPVIVEF